MTMSIKVKIGQVWRNKDKRRNTIIEIIKVDGITTTPGAYDYATMTATGLVVGTETEKEYKVERLLKSWELVSYKAEKPAEKRSGCKLPSLCVGAGGYEDYDGEWIECSCQRPKQDPAWPGVVNDWPIRGDE